MIDKLKQITEKKIGFEIKNYNDCTRLSDIIYTETGIELNYNTIRRFFGIVKTVKPSNYTLDTLCKFNGYKNYNDYVINFHLKNRWKDEFEIVRFMQEDQIDELPQYIAHHLHTNSSFILKLAQILRELMIDQNFEVLTRIFSLEKMQIIYFTFDEIAYIGNNVGPLLFKINMESKACNKLLLNLNFQDIIISIYVDYYNLNNYYGNIILFLLKHTTRDNVSAFCKGVLNLDSFFESKPKNNFHKCNMKSNFHPILKSRVIAQKLFFKGNYLKILEDYDDLIKNNNTANIDFYFEIITTAIITKNFEVMKWIINKFKYETNFTHIYKFEHYEHFGLMSILYYQHIGNKEKCKLWIDSISIDNFVRSYEKIYLLYYTIFKYHFCNQNRIKILNAYLKRAEKLYPKFFSEKYLLEYFD
jgi:tetratricopeptide (TPR) repeat protein